jgi:uncharacterized protein YkwD
MDSAWIRSTFSRGIVGLAVAALVVLSPGSFLGAAQDRDGSAEEGGLSAEMIDLIAAHNRERAAQKLEPLTANAKLTAAALIQARDMAAHDKLSHDGTDGSQFFERIQRQGYTGRRMAENIAFDQKTVAQVMREWMASPHHRDNILGPYSEIGVARVKSKKGVPYWCTTFGLPRPTVETTSETAVVVEAVNQARTKAGKPPLKASAKLARSAQKIAEGLAAEGDLGKAKPSYADQVRDDGYRYQLLGEAGAAGQLTGTDVVKDLLERPENVENFLGKYSEIGVGVAISEKKVPFWYVLLAQPRR